MHGMIADWITRKWRPSLRIAEVRPWLRRLVLEAEAQDRDNVERMLRKAAGQ